MVFIVEHKTTKLKFNVVMWIFILLLFLIHETTSNFNCDPNSQLNERIQTVDLIITGRFLSVTENDAVVTVLKILKGFEIINEVKKQSHNNDYHLIVVKTIKILAICKTFPRTGEDFILYLKRTNEPNFFELTFGNEFGDGSIERKIFTLLNGEMSSLTRNNDPCQKLNCKYGATCQKWPGNPPTAVCHCSTTHCKSTAEDKKICGSNGIFYESECHLKRNECFIQKSIKQSPISVCDPSVARITQKGTDLQQDEISSGGVINCLKRKCPPYATCISYPYPHCKCPSDECLYNSPAVCGNDDITYTNICELKKVSCKANRLIGKQHFGPCDICKFVKCEYNGLCKMNEDYTSTTCICPDLETACKTVNQITVCGSDDVTYLSECHMKIESCRKKVTLTVIHKGNCKRNIQEYICLTKQCDHGSRCVITEENSMKLSKCSCDHIHCGNTWSNPVCGDDGETYASQCFLQRAACEKRRTILVQYEQQCEQNPCLGIKCMSPHQYCRVDVNGKGRCVCPESCPKIVQPVCGNDNVTYDSICHLLKNACSIGKQIWIIYNGVCSEEPRCQEQEYVCLKNQICRSDLKHTKCECPTCPDFGVGEHVCGTDGKTYRSECHLKNIACVNNNDYLKIANIGACDACRNKKCAFYSICRMNRFGEPQCICPTDCVYVSQPVCGSDGRTYENECFLKVKSCAENRPISLINQGTCKKCSLDCPIGQMCSDGKCVCRDKCPEQKLKVCGSDGRYYEGECELKRQACIQKKTIRIDFSEASCISRHYISDETGSIDKYSNKLSLKSQMTCNCNKIGSVNSLCDQASGKCECKTGVVGQSCDRCNFGYWEFSSSGCTACSCNKFGSESVQCDLMTGKCNCKPLALGRYCSVCPQGYAMSNDGCQENYRNMDKIDADELGFERDSFAKSFFTGNSDYHLYINITFLPYSQDGIIFYLYDLQRSSDFLSLILKNGFIEYRFELGSGICSIKSTKSLILGKSHSVLIERFGRRARLIVDDAQPVHGESPSFLSNLDTGSIFILGQTPGLKTNTLNNTNSVTDGFVGCLKSLKIIAGDDTNHYLMNQQTMWILESSNVKPNCPNFDFIHNKQVIEDVNEIKPEKDVSNVKEYCQENNPCQNGGLCSFLPENIYNCKCLPGFQGNNCEEEVSPIWKFKHNSHVILPSDSLQLRKRLKLELTFLPTSENGLLAFITDGHDKHSAFISVLLSKGYVEVTCRTPIGVTKLISIEAIKMGKWNSVVVLKAAKYIYLNLNQTPRPIKKRLIPKSFMDVAPHVRRKLTQFRITNKPLFFGGVDIAIHDRFSTVVSLKPNFNGAIQKIIINGEKLRLQNPDIIMQNISQWQGAPCGPLHNPCSKTDPENNYCIADMNKAMCFCNPKYEHLCMKNSMQQDNPSITNFNRKFLGKSYVKYSSTKMTRVKSTSKNNIRVKIKTEQSDGLILLLKKTHNSKRNFLVIAIRNSVIEVAINLGGSNGIIRITSNQKISDNKWHNIQVIRNNRNVVLLVDSKMFRARMHSDDAHITLETDGWMWLGGAKKKIEGFPWEYNTILKGCIGELYVDEVAYNLISDARQNYGPILKC